MTENERKDPTYSNWSILELMGHRRLGGYVEETTVAGKGMLRIDVCGTTQKKPVFTQFYPPSSIYCLTPTTEEVARAVGEKALPDSQPVHEFEIPQLRQGQIDLDD